jgi:hypothetical protein
MTGFRVRRIRRELRATGLRSGDLITAIDDIALTSLDALTRLKTVARRRKQVVVHVNRLGTQHQWPIKIVKGPVPEMVEPPDAVPAAKGDPEVHVLKAEALADPDWTRQVRVIPHYKDGRPQGFKLVGIRPGSVFRQIGLRSGDVLKAIDGQPMDSPAKALEAYSTIQKTRAFVLSIERRGRPKTLSVRIEGQLPEDLKIPADRVPVQHMQLEGQLEVRMNGPAHGVGEGALEVVMRDARLVKGDSQWNLGVVRYAATLQRGRYVGRAQLTGGDLQGEGEVQYRGGFSRYTARIDVQASPAIADSLTDAFDKERKATLVCWSQHHCEFKALGAEIPRRTRRKRRTPAPR